MTLSVGPNQSTDATFAAALGGSTIRVAVADPDGIQADNERYGILGASARPTVLVVTATGDIGREAFYVQQALAAASDEGASYEIVASSAEALSALSLDRVRPDAAVLLLSTSGLERRGRELLAAYVGEGGGILIAAGPNVDGEVAADVFGEEATLRVTNVNGKPLPRTLAPVDVRHPLFQPFGSNAGALGLVTFQKIARIAGSACQPIARFTSGETALLDCSAGKGRGLVIASDLDNRWSDFPRHAAFVPFVHEAIRYLAGARSQPGEYLIADVPAGVRRVPGVATLSAARQGGTTAPLRVAVNVDPREGDPARISVQQFQSAVTRLKDVGAGEARVEARQQEDRQHLWQYVIGMMIVALAIEGVVASRTA